MKADVIRQMSISAHDPSFDAAADWVVKVDDLGKPMYTSICSARTRYRNRRASDERQRLLERFLSGGNLEVWLSLPAMIVPAMVLNSCSHPGAWSEHFI